MPNERSTTEFEVSDDDPQASFVGLLSQQLLWVEGRFELDEEGPRATKLITTTGAREAQVATFSFKESDVRSELRASEGIAIVALREKPDELLALEVETDSDRRRWRVEGPVIGDLEEHVAQVAAKLAPAAQRRLRSFLLVDCIDEFEISGNIDQTLQRNLSVIRRSLLPPLLPPGAHEPTREGVDWTLEASWTNEDEAAIHEARAQFENRPEPDFLEALKKQQEEEEAAEQEVEEKLAAWSDRPPPFVAEPRSPAGLCIDNVIELDHQTLLIKGWLWDVEDRLETIELVTYGGARTPVSGPIFRTPRADVIEMYTDRFGSSAKGDHGFITIVEVSEQLMALKACNIELRTSDTTLVKAGSPIWISDPFRARDELLRAIPEFGEDSDRLIEEIMHPALERIQRRCRSNIEISRTFEFGPPIEKPDFSIVIPLFQRMELVEFQLAQLSDDPDLERTELVFVLDSPDQDPSFEKKLVHLSDLYRLPLRLIVMKENVGYAAATNIGVASTSAPIVVLQHSDVFAAAPGWLSAMKACLDSNPKVGVVGPKLLYEDESIQSAGVEFDRSLEADGRWAPTNRFRGFPRGFSGAQTASEVIAVSGACLMLRRETFDEIGGLSDFYIAGDFEASELCLKCREKGLVSYYLPAAELTHLEAMSKAVEPGWKRNPSSTLYNRWLQNRRWHQQIEKTRID